MRRTIFFLLPMMVLPFLLLACQRDDTVGVEEIQMVMPQDGKAVHPKHGTETWFAYGAMSGEEGTPANGVAQAYLFEDGAYTLTMQLNIEPAADGSFYEVWLEESEDELLSTGHLTNYFGDARHQLTFESDEDLSSLLRVVVTRESDDGNPRPSEQVVARGLLKPTER